MYRLNVKKLGFDYRFFQQPIARFRYHKDYQDGCATMGSWFGNSTDIHFRMANRCLYCGFL